MILLRRALLAAAPVLAVVAVFALALAHHLGEPARAARAFQARWTQHSAAPGAAVADGDFIALSRACFGACPSYDVRIEAGGRVEFAGDSLACVARPGPQRIDGALARRLVAAAIDSGLMQMPEPPPPGAAPAPAVTLVARHGTAWRRIAYAGGFDAPALPAAVAQAVDAAANDARWLPALDAEGRRRCALPVER
jgi:hypothetical protein